MSNVKWKGKENMNDATNADVQLSTQVLGEQTLAVDLARAEIDQAIATAHRYPRSIDIVLKKIETMACYNEAAAENCIYSLPRGGKPIIGASIGFANVVAQSWGNCTDAARIVYIDRKEKVIIAEGGFHDLETNRKTVLPVQRRIVDKNGRLFSDDMIMVTGMAAASIARRNAILNAVPRALWFPIYEKALSIVRGSVETFAERKEKALRAFSQFGVKPEQVYAALGLKGEDDLTLEHLAPLRGMYTALREGNISVEEMFDPRRLAAVQSFETVSNPLADEDGEVGAPAKEDSPVATGPRRGRPRGSANKPKEDEALAPWEPVPQAPAQERLSDVRGASGSETSAPSPAPLASSAPAPETTQEP
jgi:hypothetical protein